MYIFPAHTVTAFRWYAVILDFTVPAPPAYLFFVYNL